MVTVATPPIESNEPSSLAAATTCDGRREPVIIDRLVNNCYACGMPPKGQRSKAGERTRATILEAAIHILGRDGPDKFSAAALAEEAGVSKATLFHHFRTFDEIPILAMEHFWAQSLAHKSGESKSARLHLLQLGSQVLDLPKKQAPLLRAHAVFLVKAMFEPRLHERFALGATQMHRALVQALTARLPERVRSDDVEILARVIEMALDGLMIAVTTDASPQGRRMLERAWRRLIDILLRGMKP